MTTTKTARKTHASSATKQRLLNMITEHASQPVTISEVFLAQRGTRRKSWSTISVAIRDMVAEGTLIARDETDAEQALRGDSRGKRARFYWPASSGRMPERTADSIFTGISLRETVGVGSKYKNRPAKARKVQTGKDLMHRPGSASEMQTGNRIERLEKRVRELETVISSLRKILN